MEGRTKSSVREGEDWGGVGREGDLSLADTAHGVDWSYDTQEYRMEFWNQETV